MPKSRVAYLALPLVVFAVTGCRYFAFEEREPWRAEAEAQCLAEQRVQPSSFVESAPAINGKGVCGMTRPLRVAAVSQGFVLVEPKATLACPLVAAVEAWIEDAVQPAAFAWFGEPVVELRQISDYSCRTMNGQAGAPISEHAFGNALDVAIFRLESGREVRVEKGWNGARDEKGFLRTIHAKACERFTTVLAPGADIFHYNHIHVDLSRRAPGQSICRPDPLFIPPPSRPRVPEGVPVARVPDHPSRAALGAAKGPTVIERSPVAHRGAATGGPLLLGPQSPPSGSFGAPLSLDERLMRSFGKPAASKAAQPAVSRGRLVPPASVPQASTGDPVVTGTVPRELSAGDLDLIDPKPITDIKRFGSEPASVFDLPRAKTRGE